MKTLIYGMQSSGASFFSYFMGQNENSVAIIDLYNRNLAPSLDCEKDIVLKCVVTTLYTWEDHRDSFKPDKAVLFLRNPFDNYISLIGKPGWRNENGTVDNKFRRLNEDFCQREKFDAIVKYEDMALQPETVIESLKALGFNADVSFLNFTRNEKDMAQFNHDAVPDYCGKPERYYQKGKFGAGRLYIRSGEVLKSQYIEKRISPAEKDVVLRSCPDVCDYYGGENG